MRALLSVYDKTGIVEFARALVDLGWEIISTGGTLAALRAAGVPAIPVSDVTQFPEILDGRVKTLHPAIHGAILARRDEAAHQAALEQHGIRPINLVAVNLYPFEATIAQPHVTEREALEQIDIGGPTLIRAAAKNFPDVVVVVDPADFPSVLAMLRDDYFPVERRRELAAKAFAHVATYDSIVADYLRRQCAAHLDWPTEITFAGRLATTLRYGENPQQAAAAYARLTGGSRHIGVLDARQLAGKALSFNNLLDADAAWSAILRFHEPAVAIVKHTIPCGLAERSTLPEAFEAAFAGDPVSAFGGIIAANRPVDGATASHIARSFFEVVIAPGFDADAIATLTKKKNLRLLEMPNPAKEPSHDPFAWEVRAIRGGWLVQEADDRPDDPTRWQVVTDREPTPSEWTDLHFAWEAVRHAKSNAIVLAKHRAIVGLGSGQPNRLESVRLAVRVAGERAAGAVLASDAFFPFADGLQAAIAAGVTAAIQPGGSVRDEEVIAAANEAGIAMVFTGTRHFRH
ncbi:MAG: bifunctional phosphoribosylaminoimidazolecarboxamide formyltransferase/inosine monophosphate cyclohydrolase [Chloroflexota bacterium]